MTHHTSSGADIPADVTWCAEPERPRSCYDPACDGGTLRPRETGVPLTAGTARRMASPRRANVARGGASICLRSLTPRQAQCLLMAAQGFGYREIGHVLGIASRTVRGHMLASAARLGATSLVNAVWTARRQLEAV